MMAMRTRVRLITLDSCIPDILSRCHPGTQPALAAEARLPPVSATIIYQY